MIHQVISSEVVSSLRLLLNCRLGQIFISKGRVFHGSIGILESGKYCLLTFFKTKQIFIQLEFTFSQTPLYLVDTDSVQEVNIYSSQEPLKIDFERYKTNVIITPKFGAIEKINVYNHMYQFNEDRPKVKYFRAIEFIDEQKNHLVLERGDIPGSFNISIYQNDFLKVLLQEDYEEEYKDYEIISIE